MQRRVADYILAVDIHTAASQRRDAVRVSLLGRCVHGAARARVSICIFVLVKQVVSQRERARASDRASERWHARARMFVGGRGGERERDLLGKRSECTSPKRSGGQSKSGWHSP